MSFISFVNALVLRFPLCVFPPQTPPVIPSAEKTLECALATDATIVFAVPSFLEDWAMDAEIIETLRRFKGVIFGGGPLSKPVGDRLADADVPVLNGYGTTETGPGCAFLTPSLFLPPKDWEWIILGVHNNAAFVPIEAGDGSQFELVYLEGPDHLPSVMNTEVNGVRGYATGDMVIRHPSDERLFHILGRIDDQIMLSTGEKTNPAPIERIICRNPIVRVAVMFGRGRAQNGVIIELVPGEKSKGSNNKEIASLRNRIWPTIEEANAFAPTHSRLFKEMILFSSPDKPLALTPKGTPRRPTVLQDYAKEIEAIYNAVEESAQTDIQVPVWVDDDDVRRFVREVVTKTLKRNISDSQDIFSVGGDSLSATWIRNSLLHALAKANKRFSSTLPSNIIYTSPSIAALTDKIMSVVHDRESVHHGLEDHHTVLQTLVSEYTQNYPQHRPSSSSVQPPFSEVVLITGTTGALGAQLLHHLASQNNVVKIYALNRSGSTPLRERQEEAFITRGLDIRLLNDDKVALIECETSVEGLALSAAVLNEMRTSTTLIIHNAWRINFNLDVVSFKPLIAGVRHLVDFALSSPQPHPPRIIFTSTVGIYSKWSSASPPLEEPVPISQLSGDGYSSSKWIGERILEEAASKTSLVPIIVRVGQVSGNEGGAWNASDWLPALVKSGQILGCLPTRDDVVSWIPSELAAAAIFEFRNSQAQYLHLVHPCPVKWSILFEKFSSTLNVPLLPWTEWLAKLVEAKNFSVGDSVKVETNPALHLVEFFQSCSPAPKEGAEALGMPLLDTKHAMKSSSALSNPHLKQLGSDDVHRWVQYWKRMGLLAI